MVEFTSNSVKLFGFAIYYYGIIIMIGVVAAIWLSSKRAKDKGMEAEFLYDALPWVLFGGIIGGRLWHIFTPPPSMVAQGITTKYYLTHPLDAINIRAGGMGIPGAVIGGLLLLSWYAWRKKEPFWEWIDILTPALPLGQAIGRWGNFFNQEVYGAPSDLPWAIYIDLQNRLPEFMNVSTYHPIFLYEALWNLGSVFLLIWIGKHYSDWLKKGDLFLMYLITYPTIRILLDFLRLDASEIGGINANQTFMAIVLLGSLIVLLVRHREEIWKKPDSGVA